MDLIPGQLGYLLLNEDGAVISSSGELENDEKSADIIMGLLNLTSSIDPVAYPTEEGFKKLSITYDSHCYIVCLSNRKIHIVKRSLNVPSDGLTVDEVHADVYITWRNMFLIVSAICFVRFYVK